MVPSCAFGFRTHRRMLEALPILCRAAQEFGELGMVWDMGLTSLELAEALLATDQPRRRRGAGGGCCMFSPVCAVVGLLAVGICGFNLYSFYQDMTNHVSSLRLTSTTVRHCT